MDRWKPKEEQPSVVEKIKNVAQPEENLKGQISTVIQRLDAQTRSLDAAVQRFQTRDQSIFSKVVKAMADRDTPRANIYATELGEIRKVEKMLTHASLALQSVSMRLNTVSEVGDLVTILSPAKGVLNGIRTEMCSIMPEASSELGSIGNLLTEIVTSSSQSNDIPINTGRVDPEAESILREAELAVEKKLKQQLPEVEFASESSEDRGLASVEA
jgi:division protein CdvB (Snf7/Vps24/ESCRT-III family)